MNHIRFDEESGHLWREYGSGSYDAMSFTKITLLAGLKESGISYEENLLFSKGITITEEEMTSLHNFWFDERYTKLDGLYFNTKDLKDKREIAKTICIAKETDTPLCIIYEEGYCEYPSDEDEKYSMVSEDGLTHIIYIGRTTGVRKFPLALVSKYSDGGGILSLGGIKELILLKGI